jgi:hypothetical protein
MIRAVIDTSVLVSAVVSPTGPNAQLFDVIANEEMHPKARTQQHVSLWRSAYPDNWRVVSEKTDGALFCFHDKLRRSAHLAVVVNPEIVHLHDGLRQIGEAGVVDAP